MDFKDSPISYIAIIIAVFVLLYYIGVHFNITLSQALFIVAIGIIIYLIYTKYYLKKE